MRATCLAVRLLSLTATFQLAWSCLPSPAVAEDKPAGLFVFEPEVGGGLLKPNTGGVGIAMHAQPLLGFSVLRLGPRIEVATAGRYGHVSMAAVLGAVLRFDRVGLFAFGRAGMSRGRWGRDSSFVPFLRDPGAPADLPFLGAHAGVSLYSTFRPSAFVRVGGFYEEDLTRGYVTYVAPGLFGGFDKTTPVGGFRYGAVLSVGASWGL